MIISDKFPMEGNCPKICEVFWSIYSIGERHLLFAGVAHFVLFRFRLCENLVTFI